MNSLKVSILVDKIVEELSKNRYRVYDSNIVKALRKSTFNINKVDGINNIKIDCKN